MTFNLQLTGAFRWLNTILLLACSTFIIYCQIRAAVESLPLKNALLLLGLALALAALLGKKTIWFLNTVGLVFAGGIIVIILYVCSIIENEKILSNSNRFFLFRTLRVVAAVSLQEPLYYGAQIPASNTNKLYTRYELLLAGMLGYLLIVLLVGVKITQAQAGALKGFFKTQ